MGVLGRPAVFDNGRPKALAGEREAGLLALLVARRDAWTRAEVLEDELWDGQRVSAAALRVTLNRLRKRLAAGGPDLLRSEPRSYRLVVTADELDAGCFEEVADRVRRAHRAGAHDQVLDLVRSGEGLWRGEAFDGFTHLPSVRVAHHHLEALRTSTLELAVAALVHLDELDAALDGAEAVLTRQPFRESTIALRSIAMARSGRSGDAVRALRDFRAELAAEVGAAIGPALASLVQQLDAGTDAAELSSPLLSSTLRSSTLLPPPAPSGPPPSSPSARSATPDDEPVVGPAAPIIPVAHFRRVMSLGAPSWTQRRDGPTVDVDALEAVGVLGTAGDAPGAGSSSVVDATRGALEAHRWAVAADHLITRASWGLAASIPEAVEHAGLIDEVLGFAPDDEHHRTAQLLCWKAELLMNTDAVAARDALRDARCVAEGRSDPHLDAMFDYVEVRMADAACVAPAAFDEAVHRLHEAIDGLDDPSLTARAFVMAQSGHLRSGRIALARAEADEAVPFDVSIGAALRLQVDLAGTALSLATDPMDVADDRSAIVTDRPAPGLENPALTARMMHLLVIRHEQCRLHELEPVMVAALQMTPRRILRPLVAAARHEVGDLHGRAEQLAVLREELRDVQLDWVYLATLSFAAEVAAVSDDVALGAAVEPLLIEHEPQVVVACSAVLVLGHIDRYTALLAALRGDLDGAITRFDSARHADERSGMRLWSAWSAHGEAAARLERGLDGDAELAAGLLRSAATAAIDMGSRRLSNAVEATRTRHDRVVPEV